MGQNLDNGVNRFRFNLVVVRFNSHCVNALFAYGVADISYRRSVAVACNFVVRFTVFNQASPQKRVNAKFVTINKIISLSFCARVYVRKTRF